MRANGRCSARATVAPSDDLPVPGGPTRHSAGPGRSGLSRRTARNSTIRSLALGRPRCSCSSTSCDAGEVRVLGHARRPTAATRSSAGTGGPARPRASRRAGAAAGPSRAATGARPRPAACARAAPGSRGGRLARPQRGSAGRRAQGAGRPLRLQCRLCARDGSWRLRAWGAGRNGRTGRGRQGGGLHALLEQIGCRSRCTRGKIVKPAITGGFRRFRRGRAESRGTAREALADAAVRDRRAGKGARTRDAKCTPRVRRARTRGGRPGGARAGKSRRPRPCGRGLETRAKRPAYVVDYR